MTRRQNVQHGQKRRHTATMFIPSLIIALCIPILVILGAALIKAV